MEDIIYENRSEKFKCHYSSTMAGQSRGRDSG
nr:MAG TPA: hypothetical protein [Caudoviricetes sp.]